MSVSVAKTKLEDPRIRLLTAAADLFAKKGYLSTSVREIVSNAGVTKPVLYYYFESKEGIFNAILEMAADNFEEILNSVLEKDGDFLERIHYLYEALCQGISEQKEFFKLLYPYILGPSQKVTEYDLSQFPEKIISTIKTMYQADMDKGEVIEIDPDQAAFLFLGLLNLFIQSDLAYLWSNDPGVPTDVMNLAFEGLKPKE